MDPAAFAILLAATFAGSAVQAATGFGFALVAAPVFLATMDSMAAMQVLVAIHIIQSVAIVPGLWPGVRGDLLRPLVLGSLAGMPAGLLVLAILDVARLKLLVGIAMLLVSTLIFVRDQGWLARPGAGAGGTMAHSPALLAAVGAGSGFLTSILVMPGPPLIMHLAVRPLPMQAARAVSLCFFAFCYASVTLLHVAAGGMGRAEWTTAALLAPAVVAGTLAGSALARRISEQVFRSALLALLFAGGLAAVWVAV